MIKRTRNNYVIYQQYFLYDGAVTYYCSIGHSRFLPLDMPCLMVEVD
jgi:hypothetical protein